MRSLPDTRDTDVTCADAGRALTAKAATNATPAIANRNDRLNRGKHIPPISAHGGGGHGEVDGDLLVRAMLDSARAVG